MSLLASLLSGVLRWALDRFAWFMGGKLQERNASAQAALKQAHRAREIDDEVAGLDEPDLDDRLRGSGSK